MGKDVLHVKGLGELDPVNQLVTLLVEVVHQCLGNIFNFGGHEIRLFR